MSGSLEGTWDRVKDSRHARVWRGAGCPFRMAPVRASPAFALALTLLVSVPVRAELSAVSRNTLVFVTSTEEGESWKAYRIVEPAAPAAFTVQGPGRVLIQMRAIVEGEADVESVAVVLLGEADRSRAEDRIVTTARVKPVVDDAAQLVDQPRARRPSEIGLFLVDLEVGTHRVTVRHSAGAELLVNARFAPPLETMGGLVVPRTKNTTEPIESVGRIAGEEGELVAEPAPVDAPEAGDDAEPERTGPRVADEWTDPGEAPIETAPTRRGEPSLDVDDVDTAPPVSVTTEPRGPLTVEAPRFALEVRGGALFNRFSRLPMPLVGLDARVPLPGLDARRWSLGLAFDVGYGAQDVVARGAGGAPVSVVQVAQTASFAGLDLRRVLYTVPDRFEAYASAGATGMYGVFTLESEARRESAAVFGVLGAFRVGGTLGDRGSRPFAELRLLSGFVSSDIVRTVDGAAGDATGYAAVTLGVGWRGEVLAEVEAD